LLLVANIQFFLETSKQIEQIVKTYGKYLKIEISDITEIPTILHRLSISTPSILHRNDGLSMDYRWSIYGGRAVKQRIFLQGESYVLGMKIKKEGKEK